VPGLQSLDPLRTGFPFHHQPMRPAAPESDRDYRVSTRIVKYRGLRYNIPARPIPFELLNSPESRLILTFRREDTSIPAGAGPNQG